MKATVAEGIAWVKDAIESNDDGHALEVLNNVRKRIYNMYTQVDIIPHINLCLPIIEFCRECDSCKKVYGFVLPNHVGTIEEAVIDGEIMELNTEWDRYRTGKNKASITAMPGGFSTEIDPQPCGQCAIVSFVITDPVDSNLSVKIGYRDGIGEHYKEMLSLASGSAIPTGSVSSFDKENGVSFTAPPRGEVKLIQNDGTLLASYAPGITIPRFRRYVVNNATCGYVSIKASRVYYPVYCHDEFIETDNQDAITHIAKSIKLSKKDPLTDSDRSAIMFYERRAKDFLVGQKGREIGIRTSTSVNSVLPSFRQLRRGGFR